MLEGGTGGRGIPPNKFSPELFLQIKLCEGSTAAAGRHGMLEGREGTGKTTVPHEVTGREAPHNYLVV